ncbi:MAG TPA: hypothetical protein VFZ59_20780 [Verrucomicrobiae bacterium]|nr:hypothetical protein [Verrucomicrobiae bacterium]
MKTKIVFAFLLICLSQIVFAQPAKPEGEAITETVTIVTDTNVLTREIERLRAIQDAEDARLAAAARISRFDLTNTLPLVTREFGAEETLGRQREKAEIKIQGDLGVADAGAHKAFFRPSLRDAEAAPVTLQTPTGEILRTRLFGLVYHDPDSGQTVLIAEPKAESIGQLESPNRLVYEDAFDDVSVDVAYTYSTEPFGSFEQDLIIRKQIPPPSEWRMGERAQLCVFTELLGAPAPKRQARTVRVNVPDDGLRVAFEDVLPTETLTWGSMSIVDGRAFSLGNSKESIPIGTTFQVLEGRTFIVEATPYRAIEAQLATLPRMAALDRKREPMELKKLLASAGGKTTPKPAGTPRIRMAQTSSQNRPGVVMDYLIVNTAMLNINFGDGTQKVGGRGPDHQ